MSTSTYLFISLCSSINFQLLLPLNYESYMYFLVSSPIGSNRMRVNNLIDESPRRWEDIEKIIEKLKDIKGCRYSLVTNNCENFVTYLRFEVTSGFRSQMAGGLLSKIFPTWYIGTYDNGKMQTEQWDEYVKAVDEGRKPRNVMPKWAYM